MHLKMHGKDILNYDSITLTKLHIDLSKKNIYIDVKIKQEDDKITTHNIFTSHIVFQKSYTCD